MNENHAFFESLLWSISCGYNFVEIPSHGSLTNFGLPALRALESVHKRTVIHHRLPYLRRVRQHKRAILNYGL